MSKTLHVLPGLSGPCIPTSDILLKHHYCQGLVFKPCMSCQACRGPADLIRRRLYCAT
jgi:hypothetical protein